MRSFLYRQLVVPPRYQDYSDDSVFETRLCECRLAAALSYAMMACKDSSDRETLKRREVDAAQLGFKPIYCLKLRADVHDGASSESRVSRTTDESHSRNLVTTQRALMQSHRG
jgi:hypothetical protein